MVLHIYRQGLGLVRVVRVATLTLFKPSRGKVSEGIGFEIWVRVDNQTLTPKKASYHAGLIGMQIKKVRVEAKNFLYSAANF